MNYSNTKKKTISFLFAGSILIASVLPLAVNETYANNILRIEKTDSTKVISSNKKAAEINKADEKVQKAKSSSNLSYNIIYYLISKFLKANPLSKPR